MRLLSSLVVVLSIALGAIGCGSDSSKSENQSSATTISSGPSGTGSTTATTSNSACEQFMTEYESFADSYIAFLKEYKSNPGDMSLLSRYSEMMQKANDMVARSKECQGDASMLPRLQKIQAKLAEAASQ